LVQSRNNDSASLRPIPDTGAFASLRFGSPAELASAQISYLARSRLPDLTTGGVPKEILAEYPFATCGNSDKANLLREAALPSQILSTGRKNNFPVLGVERDVREPVGPVAFAQDDARWIASMLGTPLFGWLSFQTLWDDTILSDPDLLE
jgi:hypothetical protein